MSRRIPSYEKNILARPNRHHSCTHLQHGPRGRREVQLPHRIALAWRLRGGSDSAAAGLRGAAGLRRAPGGLCPERLLPPWIRQLRLLGPSQVRVPAPEVLCAPLLRVLKTRQAAGRGGEARRLGGAMGSPVQESGHGGGLSPPERSRILASGRRSASAAQFLNGP